MSELLTTTLGAEAVGTDLSVTTVLETVFVSAAFAVFIKELRKNKIKADKPIPINKGFNISIVSLLVVILS